MRRPATLVPIGVLIVVWLIQAVRATHGVDFSDEMQYYGELTGLVASGRLFSNDLFIQQGVYLLTYPVMRPLFWLAGTTGLIFGTRALLAGFLLWVFRRVRRGLERGGAPAPAASLAALGVVLMTPLYNLYSVSYNTVGLGLLAVCFAELVAWRTGGARVRVWWWSGLLAALGVTYPPLAAAVFAVVAVRIAMERDVATIRRGVVALATIGAASLAVASFFVRAPDLVAAIAFSGKLTAGGTPWLRLVVVVIVVTGGVVLTSRPRAVNAPRGRLATIAFAAGVVLAAAAVFWFGTLARVLGALASVAAGFALTGWPDPAQARARHWITAMFLVSGVAVSMSSSHGASQILGPASLAAPLLIALALAEPTSSAPGRRDAARIAGALVLAGFVVCVLADPYRDEPLWRQTAAIDDAGAFRFMRVTTAKADAIREVRRLLADVPPGKSLMVVGAQPWVYFATGTRPDTDMVFMHSMAPPGALAMLAARLKARRPDYVVRMSEVSPAVDAAVDEIVAGGPYRCDSRAAGAALLNTRERLNTFYDVSPTVIVCRLQRAP